MILQVADEAAHDETSVFCRACMQLRFLLIQLIKPGVPLIMYLSVVVSEKKKMYLSVVELRLLKLLALVNEFL